MGGATAAASAAAASAALANAVKACGTIVHLEPGEFQKILSFQKDPLVVQARGGFLTKSYKYLTGYKGLAFFCKSRTELTLPGESQRIQAKKISIPDM